MTLQERERALKDDVGNFDTRIYVGAVSHRRVKPVSHRFTYSIFSLLINIDELPDLDRSRSWFVYNRFGLMGFRDKDHGAKDGSPLRQSKRSRRAAVGSHQGPGCKKRKRHKADIGGKPQADSRDQSDEEDAFKEFRL